MLLLFSNNINIQSPWMLSLEIFGSVCAAAADYRQIRYRPSIRRASKDFINEYNNTSQFFTSWRKISCSEKSFHIFHFVYIFKTNVTELIDESADVCLHFSGHMWRHRPLKEYSVFVGIRVACTSFSPYILWIGSTTSDAIIRSLLWSTATRSSPLGYFNRLLQVVDNWPHILW